MSFLAPLRRVHDRVVPLPPLFLSFPLDEWPQELYGSKEAVRRSIRTRFELVLLLLCVALLAPLLDVRSFSDAHPRVFATGMLVWAVSLLVVTLSMSSGADGLARRIGRRNAARRPHLVPVSLLEDFELGDRVSAHLRVLSPEQREIASTLLSDGFEGSVGDLVSLSQALQPA